jgi:hypothetical protein
MHGQSHIKQKLRLRCGAAYRGMHTDVAEKNTAYAEYLR